MHNSAFSVAGIDADYQARQVTSGELPAAVAGLRSPDILGANLSLPHKQAALPLLDELSPAARAIGAVNTIINRGGVLVGENTDAPGFLEALRGGGAPAAGNAVVLGAGGAARAAVWALVSQGWSVRVVNRSPDRAAALTRQLGGMACLASAVPWGSVDLLVNASSAGLDAPEESPLPELPAFAPGALVYDMVYKPAETRLMRDARASGYRAENGLSMLAQQARLAFLAWTGADVPIRVFLDALGAPMPEPDAGAQGGTGPG